MNVQDRLDIMQDKLDIIDAVNAAFINTDERNWDLVKTPLLRRYSTITAR